MFDAAAPDAWQFLMPTTRLLRARLTRAQIIRFGRTSHGQSFMRTLAVEDVHEFVEAVLLLQEVGGGRLGGFFLQGQMHAFMAAILLGMARLDPLDANAQAKPPDVLTHRLAEMRSVSALSGFSEDEIVLFEDKLAFLAVKCDRFPGAPCIAYSSPAGFVTRGVPFLSKGTFIGCPL
jgi:hypothetical protein